jgi:hypothetical protein
MLAGQAEVEDVMRKGVAMLAGCSVLFMTLAARAEDSFLYDGFGKTGTIKGLRDGRLLAIIQEEPQLFELNKVEKIRLDGTPRMQEAELARHTDAKKAAAFYKDVIRSLNDPALKLLAEARAIEPTDADGRWTEAVAYFLDVYAAAPGEATWALRPTKMPAAGSSMLKESADRIQNALRSIKSDEARKNLKNLQLDILTKAGDTEAAERLAKELATGVVEETPKAPPPKPVDPAAQESAAVAELHAALQAKDYAQVLKRTEGLLATATGEQAVGLWQMQAKAYEEQNRLDLATAAILRIIAHYPSSPAAPGALLQAAELQRRANHPAAAKALLSEILASYPDSREAVLAKSQ